MTLNFGTVTQSQLEIWEWLYSKISSWNTNAPGGSKVKILQNIKALYMNFDLSQTPMGIWWHWRVSNPSIKLTLHFTLNTLRPPNI